MATIIISRSDDVSPLVTYTSNFDHDKISSAIVDLIDSYDNYKKNSCYVTLPEDIWIQIFISLSVKSLALVMCVCKDWCKLIKDRSFVRKHLQFQKKLSNSSGHFILHHYSFVDKEFNYFLFNGESITNETKSSSTSASYRNIFHSSRGELDYSFTIDGPVNGLYCLQNQEGRIVIWNPAANEVGFLPIPQQCLPNNDPLDNCIIGFGTDPLDEDDYKVILTCLSYDTNNDYEDTPYSMLYTTRTNSWRCLKNVYRLLESLNNTYLNGSYYWMLDGMCCAIEFDMRDEDFRTISTPANGNLALHNNHITLFDTNENLNEIDIWVMLEDISWVKLKKVCLGGIQGHVVKTLGFWKTESDLIIVVDNSDCHHAAQTLLYDTTSRGIMNIGPKGLSSGFRAFDYYESLVSLSGDIIKYQGDDYASLMDAICDFFLEVLIDNQDSTDNE